MPYSLMNTDHRSPAGRRCSKSRIAVVLPVPRKPVIRLVGMGGPLCHTVLFQIINVGWAFLPVVQLSGNNVQATVKRLTNRPCDSYDFAMTISNDNPFAPPETVGLRPPVEKHSLRWIVAQFQSECRAPSGAALFFSLLGGWVSFMLQNVRRVPQHEFFWMLFAGLSASLLGVALGILRKNMWAVRVFLLFNWLMALLTTLTVFSSSGSLIPGQVMIKIFFAVTSALAATQCHRVLNWSRQIKLTGYPLSIRPENVSGSSV